MKRGQIFAAMALIAIGLTGCSSSDSQNSPQVKSQVPPPSTNPPAATAEAKTTDQPDFVFGAYDTEGSLHQSSEWIGKQPVVINFWGTWCPPCRREIPDLVKIYTAYRSRGVEIVGIAVRDNPSSVRQFADVNGMTWPMLMVDQDVIRVFPDIRNVPTTIFLDRDGREVRRFVGSRSYEDFKAAFESIL